VSEFESPKLKIAVKLQARGLEWESAAMNTGKAPSNLKSKLPASTSRGTAMKNVFDSIMSLSINCYFSSSAAATAYKCKLHIEIQCMNLSLPRLAVYAAVLHFSCRDIQKRASISLVATSKRERYSTFQKFPPFKFLKHRTG
jgi:hypothetical protein